MSLIISVSNDLQLYKFSLLFLQVYLSCHSPSLSVCQPVSVSDTGQNIVCPALMRRPTTLLTAPHTHTFCPPKSPYTKDSQLCLVPADITLSPSQALPPRGPQGHRPSLTLTERAGALLTTNRALVRSLNVSLISK